MPVTDVSALPPFGQKLRRWRSLRGVSQLDLAAAIGGSGRHVSFIETGRARPREALVLRICEALAIPLRSRNDLLRAAGFAPLYEEQPPRPSDGPWRLVRSMLEAHRPWPATVIDRHWGLLAANPAARALFGADCVGKSALDLLLEPGGLRTRLLNFPDVVASLSDRIAEELLATPEDDRLAQMLDRLRAALPPRRAPRAAEPVLRARYRHGAHELSAWTAVARFSGAGAVALDELRVELVYPSDAVAAAWFASLDPAAPARPAP